MSIRRRASGIEVELFVAVLGASNLHLRGGRADAAGRRLRSSRTTEPSRTSAASPRSSSPTASRAGSRVPCRYEPTIQRTYAEWARHYGTAIVPARPYKPRDKAKVEVGVQIAQRWILARLRNETFFSLEALNRRIRRALRRPQPACR